MVQKRTTYSYCCITNMFTLACPPLSPIKYDTEHLMTLGFSVGCFPCRRCATSLDDTGSKWLEELCPLLFSPLNYSILQQLAKCCGGKEEKSDTRWRELRGRDEVVIGWEAYHLLDLANICQTRLCLDCGAIRVCLYTAVFPWWGTQSVTCLLLPLAYQ